MFLISVEWLDEAKSRARFSLPGREMWPGRVRPIRFWDLDRFQEVRWGPDRSCVFDNSRGQLP